MKTLLVATLAGLGTGGHTLATDYGRERTLHTTSELELDMETTLFEMKIDGKPPEEDRGPRGGSSSSLVRKCALSDRILEGAPGAPGRVKRTFETLHDESKFSFGEEERSDERDYPLQGVTLELTRDEKGGVLAELVDGPKPEDDGLLEDHALELALDAFLPEGAVELDASWELDDAAVKRGLATALDAKLFADPPPDEGGGRRGGPDGERRGSGRGGAARSLAHVEWQGKAKLTALDDEHDGIPCARIELELEGEGELPVPSFRGPPRGGAFDPTPPATVLDASVKARLEGALLFSLENGRPVALELDGELSTDMSSEHERDGHTFSMHSVQSGRLTLTMTTEESGS